MDEPIGYLSTPAPLFTSISMPSDRALDRIVGDYRASHPETHFEPMVIAKADLQARRYFAFPRTEQLFVQQGYAAEFDARTGPIGRGTTAYLNEQKSVLHVQTLILAEIVRIIGPDHFGWREDFA